MRGLWSVCVFVCIFMYVCVCARACMCACQYVSCVYSYVDVCMYHKFIKLFALELDDRNQAFEIHTVTHVI